MFFGTLTINSNVCRLKESDPVLARWSETDPLGQATQFLKQDKGLKEGDFLSGDRNPRRASAGISDNQPRACHRSVCPNRRSNYKRNNRISHLPELRDRCRTTHFDAYSTVAQHTAIAGRKPGWQAQKHSSSAAVETRYPGLRPSSCLASGPPLP